MQLFEQRRFAARRTKLFLFDAEMLEDLIDRRVADVIDQLQRAKPRQRSEGLVTTRRNASASLMCADSANLIPPNLRNGTLCLPSSISRSNECELERNSTAICASGTPSSRSSAMRCATKRDCSFSSCALTTTGGCPPSMRE